MILSKQRILTTHVGSLPRNDELSSLLVRREDGEGVDPDQLAREMDRAVQHVVRQQADAGIDIANDGEQQGVVVAQVNPGGPAAGIVQPADVLTAFDGQPITSADEFLLQMARKAPGAITC